MKLEKLTTQRDGLGESGCWDARARKLWWVDVPGKAVKLLNPASLQMITVKTESESVSTLSIEASVSFAIPRRNGQGLLIAQGRRLDFLGCDKQTPFVSEETLALPESVATNDGKCDAMGRLWFGTMSPQQDTFITAWPDKGGLYSVSPGGEVKAHLEGIRVSNGLDWTTDGQTLLHVDSGKATVTALDFDLEAGAICNPRQVLSWSEPNSGFPDGLTIDENNKVWVAMNKGSKVAQFDIETGKELQSVDLSPTTGITCANFGGDDLDELYITTGQMGLTPDDIAAQPGAGMLYRCTGLGIKGRAPNFFAG